MAKLALTWTLSQGITATLPPGEEKLFRLAMELAPNCGMITASQKKQLETVAEKLQPIFTA